MKTRTLLIVVFLLLSACVDRNNQINAQIEAQLHAKPMGPLNLALVGPSSWERVCVLGPYTTNEHAEKVLGFKWNATVKTSIGDNEGINVLVFAQARQVIAYTEYPRNKVDFSKMVPRCLNRNQANLIQSRDGNWTPIPNSAPLKP
ncbi:MAG: hypothetical protein ACYC4K_04005 [Thiobacillus sp.]